MQVSEVYTSIQCEGPSFGTGIQFVRFGGCNMRCPGWPCDTLYSVLPEHYKDWSKETPSSLLARVQPWPKQVCITGGEPFLQKADDLEEFVMGLLHKGYQIDIFTNGSIPFPSWTRRVNARIVMDWKLPSSGEGDTNLEERFENLTTLGGKDAVKFVIGNKEELDLAIDIWAECIGEARANTPRIFVGKVWDSEITDDWLVKEMINRELDWELNVQIHKVIWPEEDRGV